MSPETVFFDLIADMVSTGRNDEQLHAYLLGEQSDFIRFNHNRIRQGGQVRQYEVQLAMTDGERQCVGYCDLTGVHDHDRDTLSSLLDTLRRRLPDCPQDPYLHYNQSPCSNESLSDSELPETQSVVDTIITRAEGLDLVGHYAAGEITRAYCNSLGQHNLHRRWLFNLDWSCHGQDNQSVKSSYAGSQWLEQEFAQRLASQREWLEIMHKPVKRLSPGRYRCYLAPAALAEIMFLLMWEGFSLKSLRTRQSPLLKLAEGQQPLNRQVTIAEERDNGFSPGFSDAGFILPDKIDLIRHGDAHNYLTDARSSREYKQPVNTAVEQPTALSMAPGQLPMSEVLQTLDTGLYISNLWYGNYSDRNTCRLTGLTRYACLWVENGVIQAPVEVMRFDDSVYRMLGENLIDLTRERELIQDPHTYDQRSLYCMHLPGALIEDFTLTL